MRHAAARTAPQRTAGRAAQLVFAAVAYATAALSTCLITLGSAVTIWGLWQWLGVN